MIGNTIIDGNYSIEELPNLKVRPYSFYRHKDGRIVKLPSDAYSLSHYLKKGLVLVSSPEEAVLPIKPEKARRKYAKRRKL